MTTVKLPKNDSRTFRMRVRVLGGTFLSLTGFTVTLTLRQQVSDVTPVLELTGQVAQPDTTYAVVHLPSNTIASAGLLFGAMRVANVATQDAYTYIFNLQVVDHA